MALCHNVYVCCHSSPRLFSRLMWLLKPIHFKIYPPNFLLSCSTRLCQDWILNLMVTPQTVAHMLQWVILSTVIDPTLQSLVRYICGVKQLVQFVSGVQSLSVVDSDRQFTVDKLQQVSPTKPSSIYMYYYINTYMYTTLSVMSLTADTFLFSLDSSVVSCSFFRFFSFFSASRICVESPPSWLRVRRTYCASISQHSRHREGLSRRWSWSQSLSASSCRPKLAMFSLAAPPVTMTAAVVLAWCSEASVSQSQKTAAAPLSLQWN